MATTDCEHCWTAWSSEPVAYAENDSTLVRFEFTRYCTLCGKREAS